MSCFGPHATSEVRSAGGDVIGEVCSKCGKTTRAMCPHCRNVFDRLDIHWRSTATCGAKQRAADEWVEATDRRIAAEKAARR